MSWRYHTNSLGTRVERRLHRWSMRSLRSWRTATGRRAAAGAAKETISSGLTDRSGGIAAAATGVWPAPTNSFSQPRVEPDMNRQDAKSAKAGGN
jgi:hypothetical protein